MLEITGEFGIARRMFKKAVAPAWPIAPDPPMGTPVPGPQRAGEAEVEAKIVEDSVRVISTLASAVTFRSSWRTFSTSCSMTNRGPRGIA
jgi:hypothetical protein